MACKSLLTVVTSAAAVPAQIDAAIALARREDAHLDVLCLGIDRSMSGYYYIGAAPLAPVMVQETMDQARDEALAAEAAVRARLLREEVRWAVDTAIAQTGMASGQIAQLARFADLVLLPKPYGKDSAPDEEMIVEAALFDGRAPVLLLPAGTVDASYGKRIVVAWDQSDQAMNAVRAALPFLKTASRVDVAIVDPSDHGPERSDPGGLLSQYLARHGVRTEVSVLARTLPRVADIICRHAEEIGGDLIVMGAYGHSRFREAILGGTTRDLFSIASVPVFAVH
mgnify:CR=1 FL=1